MTSQRWIVCTLVFLVLSPNGILARSASDQQSCPNLSGIYKLASTTYRKWVQHDCDLINNQFGVGAFPQIRWIDPVVKITLDGKPSCTNGICKTGFAYKDKIVFQYDTVNTLKDPVHGKCKFHQEELYVLNSSEILRKILALKCTDGYTGWLDSIMNRI